MRHAYIFAVLLITATPVVLSGCYTQLANDGGGYYGYGRRVYRVSSVRSDTIFAGQQQAGQKMRYDTTMKGDTMYIQEVPDSSSASGSTAPSTGNEEVVNNYYSDDGSYWPYYWAPGPAFAISFGWGWPYSPWYDPWCPSSYAWDYWGYPGFYPPVFNAYYPFYGRGFYGGYGHGFYGGYGRRYAYGYGGYPYSGIGRRSAGIGEERSIALGPSRSGIPSSIAMQNRSISNNTLDGHSSSISRHSVSEVSGDRNSPIHAVAPDAASPITRSEGVNSSASLARASQARVIVRQSADGSMTTTSMARSASGRQVVVVRRSASSGLSSRSFGPSGRSGYGYRSSGGRGSYNTGRSSYGGARSSGNGQSSGNGRSSGNARSSGGGGSSSGRGSSGGGGGETHSSGGVGRSGR